MDDNIASTFKTIKSTKSLEKNPIYDMLRKLEITIDGQGGKSIFNLLEEESNALSQSAIENYLKEGYTYDLILKGINTLKMAKSIITGMMTKTDLETPFGFNQSIINYLNKNQEGKNIEKYNIVEEADGMMMYKELDTLIDKLEFLLDLSNSNNEAKEKEHTLTREKYNTLLLEYFKDNNFTYNGKPLLAYKEEILNESISDEFKILKYETALHEEFKKLNLTKEQYDGFIKEVFSKFFENSKDIRFNESDSLSPHMTSISSYNLFIHLLSTFSVNSTEIAFRFKNIFSNSNVKLAPFFGQEQAAKIGYSAYKNTDLFTAAFNILNETSGSTDILNNSNIVSILGISGSGKTSAPGQFILKMLLQDDPTMGIYISGPNDNRINALNKALTSTLEEEYKENNIVNFDKKAMFDMFVYEENEAKEHDSFIDILEAFQNKNKVSITDSSLDPTLVKNTDGKFTLITNENERRYKFKSDLTSTPKAIFIDEITHFSKFEIQLLDEIGKHYGITIFTFGDTSQKGYLFSNQKYSINEIGAIKTPYLSSTIRAANIHKKDNNLLLNILASELEKYEVSIEDVTKRTEAQINFLNQSKRVVKYFQTDEELNGDKLVTELTEKDAITLKNALLNVRKIAGKESEKLGIITSNGMEDSKIISILTSVGFTPDMYKFFSSENDGINPVQGQEGEYFINVMRTYELKEPNLITNYIVDLYTGASRALTGSITIGKSVDFNKYNLIAKSENSTFTRPLSIDRIEKLKEERIKILESFTKDFKGEEKTPSVDTILDAEKNVEDASYEDDKSPEIQVNIPEINSIIDPTIEVEGEEKGSKFNFYSFYNRLGVNPDPVNPDSFLITKFENQGKLEDLQIIRGADNSNISKKDVDTFIKIKNIVSLYFDNEKELKVNLTSNKDIDIFLVKHLKISTNDLIKEVLKKNFFIIGKKYEDALDNSAFKFSNDINRKLSNNDLFIRNVIRIKINENTNWDLTLTALPQSKSLENEAALAHLSEKSINDYKSFENKLREDVENQGIVELKLKDVSRAFTQTTSLVSSIKNTSDENANPITVSALLNPETTPIPGVFVNTLEDGKFIKIFSGNSESIRSEFNAGHEQKKKLDKKNNKGESTIDSMRGRAYIVLSFDNDDQFNSPNRFRKVLPIYPKKRGFDVMINEYIDNQNSKKSSDEKGRYNNILLGKYDGIKMFYELKRAFKVLDSTSTESNWDLYVKGLNSTSDSISSKKEYSERYRELVKLLNKYNTFEEFNSQYNKDKKNDKFRKNQKLNPYSSFYTGVNVGTLVLGNYKFISNIDNLFKIKNLVSDTLSDREYYYNPSPAKIDTAQNLSYLSTEFLDKFVIHAVPEMPRYVVDLNSTITSYLNNEVEEEIPNTPVIETTPQIVETLEVEEVINEEDEFTIATSKAAKTIEKLAVDSVNEWADEQKEQIIYDNLNMITNSVKDRLSNLNITIAKNKALSINILNVLSAFEYYKSDFDTVYRDLIENPVDGMTFLSEDVIS